jgi:glycosyltransferase involved in cell wall biosynthesis
MSSTHLVLIPSYNTGPKLLDTVREALQRWSPVWVVIDGSTDGAAAALQQMAQTDSIYLTNGGGLKVWVLPHNQGKGAALLHGLHEAQKAGFSHALTMDADGQHPADLIPPFMQTSLERPEAMILGRPIFDASAPLLRVRGRRVSNAWTHLETLGAGVGDSLYGFRVYPILPLITVMHQQRWMRRFDFDTEAVVRLVWRGVKPINLDAPVKYLSSAQGGVSHFRYGRDNLLLSWMHLRLMLAFAWRWPGLVWRRFKKQAPFQM